MSQPVFDSNINYLDQLTDEIIVISKVDPH